MFSTFCGYGNILCSISIFRKFLYHFEIVCPIGICCKLRYHMLYMCVCEHAKPLFYKTTHSKDHSLM